MICISIFITRLTERERERNLFGIQTKYKELQKYRIKSSHRSCVSKKCAIPLTEALSNRSNFYDLLDINS